MPTNGIKQKDRSQRVLTELAGLSNSELERLLPQVYALRAGRGLHVLGDREARLLQQINAPLPARLQSELIRLAEKRRAGTLTNSEAQKLHRLTDRVELLDARRLRCLVELAGLRKTTLEKLMRSLGLNTPAYV